MWLFCSVPVSHEQNIVEFDLFRTFLSACETENSMMHAYQVSLLIENAEYTDGDAHRIVLFIGLT